MPDSKIEGNIAWDASGRRYQSSWLTEDLRVAARQIKKGALLGEWLESDVIKWWPEPSAEIRASTRTAQAWLEKEVGGRGPFVYRVWKNHESGDMLLLAEWNC